MKRPLIGESQVWLTAEGVANSSAKLVAPGSVLVVVRSGILKHSLPIALTTRPVTVNQDVKALTPNQVLAPAYLARLLKHLEPTVLSWVRATTADNFPIESLLDIRVDLPALADQLRIAAILDASDAIRIQRRVLLADFDSLTKSIFDAAFEGEDSRLPRVRLGDVIKWSNGKFLPAKAQTGGPFAVYGGNGVNGTHNEFLYEERRLIIGRVGAYCGVVHLTQPKSWVTDNALIGTLLDPGLTVEYLLPALSVANLNQYAATSGQPSISAGRIADVLIPRPSLADQQKFAAQASAIHAERIRVELALVSDQELFGSLESHAFSGGL